MRMAEQWSLERGGLYETTASAINIWRDPAVTPQLREDSELIGTIHVDWGCPNAGLATIYALEVAPGWSVAEVRRHIGRLFGEPMLALAA